MVAFLHSEKACFVKVFNSFYTFGVVSFWKRSSVCSMAWFGGGCRSEASILCSEASKHGSEASNLKSEASNHASEASNPGSESPKHGSEPRNLGSEGSDPSSEASNLDSECINP